MSVIITGFEPFEGDSYNVSGAIADKLNGSTIANHTVVGVVLPVVRYICIDSLQKHINLCDPVLIINLGYAKMAASMRIERIAINIDDFRIADNGGNQPIDEPIFDDGAVAYLSTLPIKTVTNSLRESNIKAYISNSAGTYLCNHIFYATLYLAQKYCYDIKAGFIHIPPDEKLAHSQAKGIIPFDEQIRAVQIIIEQSLSVSKIVKLPI